MRTNKGLIAKVAGVVTAASLIVSIVTGAAPAATTPRAAIPCRGWVARQLQADNFDIYQVWTFSVHPKPLAKAYKVGQVAKVHVLVERPGPADPAGQGVPMPSPTYAPAEGVNVGVGVKVGPVFLPGYGVTDANGEVDVPVKLQSYTPAGIADIEVFAYKNDAESPCVTIQEDGYTSLPRAFKVTK